MAYEELQLLSRYDLNLVREVPNSIDEEKVKNCIMEAQHLDLRPLLGDAFYWALLDSFYDEEFSKLMEGDDYEDDNGNDIHFVGLRKCIAYFAMARVAATIDTNYTSHALVRKKSQYSDHLEPEDKGSEISALKSAAYVHWNDVKKYLNAKEDDFPIWKESCNTKKPKGKIKIIAAG